MNKIDELPPEIERLAVEIMKSAVDEIFRSAATNSIHMVELDKDAIGDCQYCVLNSLACTRALFHSSHSVMLCKVCQEFNRNKKGKSAFKVFSLEKTSTFIDNYNHRAYTPEKVLAFSRDIAEIAKKACTDIDGVINCHKAMEASHG